MNRHASRVQLSLNDVCLSPPQVLAQNSGFDPQETLVKLQSEFKETGALVGVDLNTGTWRDASLYTQTSLFCVVFGDETDMLFTHLKRQYTQQS